MTKHTFGVDLGRPSRVTLDGNELRGVRNFSVSQDVAGLPVVVLEIYAERVTGITESTNGLPERRPDKAPR